MITPNASLKFQNFIFLFVAVSIIASSNICTAQGYDPQPPTTLTDKQIELIQGKSFFLDGYNIRVASGEVDGIPRTVVFLGETHFKTKAALKETEEILNQFDMYGTEGVELDKYWGKGLGLNYLITFINFFYKKVFEGSTVHVAENKKETQSKKGVTRPIIVELEKNYDPPFQDNMAVLLMPFSFAAAMANKCIALACTTWPSFALLSRLRGFPNQVTKALVIYVAIDIMSRLLFDEAKWQDNIFIFSTGLLYNRNAFMSENIIKGFQAHPEKQNILVVAGFAHQSGIMKTLKDKFNFKEVEIDEVDTSEGESPSLLTPVK